jgi:MFS family permease
MAIYLIVLMCLLNHIAFAGSRVLVSLYALELGANQMIIGMIMALYSLSPMLFAIYIGRLADRVGPKLPMLMGTVGVGVALILPPLFPGLTTLYIFAFLIGTSFYFFFITVTGITGGIGGSENRVSNYALMSLGFSGGNFVGPIVAGFSIDHLGHLPTFLLLVSFTLAPILLLSFKTEFLPHSLKQEKAGVRRNSLDLWHIPTLRNTFIASGIITAAWDLFLFYMPVYGHAIGMSASIIGTVIGFSAIAAFVIRLVLPYLVQRSGEEIILIYAIFVAAFAFMLFPFFQSAYALAAISFLLGLGLGCGQPMTMSLIYSLSPLGRIAESSGLRVTVNNFVNLVIPLVFGSMGAAFGVFPVFLSNSAMLVAGGFIMRKSRPQDPGNVIDIKQARKRESHNQTNN